MTGAGKVAPGEEALARHSRTLLHVWELTRVHAHDTFQDAAIAIVREEVPFDGALWGYATVGGAVLRTHAVHLVDIPGEAVVEYERVRDVDPVARAAIRDPGRSILFGTRRPLRRADPAWLAFNRRWGIRSIISVMLVQEFSNLAMFLSFYRNGNAGDFTEGERRLHESMAPHLASAYQAARLRGLEHKTPLDQAGARGAISDGRGRLHMAEPGFEQVLRREWSTWRGPSLPDELSALVSSGGRYRGGTAVVWVEPPVNGFTNLWARPMLGKDRLSPRELEIAEAWGGGRSAEEIAESLGLSPFTVRNRLQDVYAKLGAHGRAAVLAALRRHEPTDE